MFHDVPDVISQYNSLTSASKVLISFCLNNQLTGGELELQFELIVALELELPDEFRKVSVEFKAPKTFRRFVQTFRKCQVRHEGWKKSLISTDVGLNSTGTYRYPLELLRRKIRESGGLGSLIATLTETIDGERVYSFPANATAMECYQTHCKIKAPIACVDVVSVSTSANWVF